MSGRNPQKLKKRIAAIRQRKAERVMDPFAKELRDFCRPLLAVAPDLSGPENAVSLGIFAWNAAFLPEERWRANFRKSIARFGLDDDAREALEGIIEEMVRQKGLIHPGDRRVVTSFDVRISGGEVFIDAKSALATKALLPHMKDLHETQDEAPACPSMSGGGCSGGCGSCTPPADGNAQDPAAVDATASSDTKTIG